MVSKLFRPFPIPKQIMKILSTMARAFFSLFLIFSFAQAEEKSGKNVFTHLIRPVLDAKCVQCHGADKDKGKLRMHTKEDFLKGGKEVGEDIVIKGSLTTVS